MDHPITHAIFFSFVVVVHFFFFIYLFEWSTMRNVCFGLGGVDSFIWITYINISYVKFQWKEKVRRYHIFFFFSCFVFLNNKMCVKNIWFPFHLVSDPRPSLILFHVLRFFFIIVLHLKHVSLSFSFSIFNSAILLLRILLMVVMNVFKFPLFHLYFTLCSGMFHSRKFN